MRIEKSSFSGFSVSQLSQTAGCAGAVVGFDCLLVFAEERVCASEEKDTAARRGIASNQTERRKYMSFTSRFTLVVFDELQGCASRTVCARVSSVKAHLASDLK